MAPIQKSLIVELRIVIAHIRNDTNITIPLRFGAKVTVIP